VNRDITARKQAEQALRASEEKYRNLVKYAPAAIYEIDLQGAHFLNVNDTMCAILKFTREELLAVTPGDLLDPASQVLFSERIRKTLAGEKIDESVGYRIRRKDGEWIYVTVNAGILSDANGEPARVAVIAYDITERKRNEEALRRTNEELSQFNRAMVGREIRMIELKKEVNELSARLGLAPVYPEIGA
ncbi:MAG: PAS domain S-box protein, partial [Desulfobacteraceae bacterium]